MHHSPGRWTITFACVALAMLVWGGPSPVARADDSLHARIDALVAQSARTSPQPCKMDCTVVEIEV